MKELWNTVKTYLKMPEGFENAFGRFGGLNYSRALENIRVWLLKYFTEFIDILATIRQRYLLSTWLGILIALAVGSTTLRYAYVTIKLAEWTARKDFQEYCQSQKVFSSHEY